MLKKLRQSKFMMLSLFVALAVIVFCPHAGHEEAHAEQSVSLASADTCCEPVLCAEEGAAEHHEHGSCEFEALHSHDFPISVATTYVPTIPVVTKVIYDEPVFLAQQALAYRSMLPQITGSPLQTLNCVRLLI